MTDMQLIFEFIKILNYSIILLICTNSNVVLESSSYVLRLSLSIKLIKPSSNVSKYTSSLRYIFLQLLIFSPFLELS